MKNGKIFALPAFLRDFACQNNEKYAIITEQNYMEQAGRQSCPALVCCACLTCLLPERMYMNMAGLFSRTLTGSSPTGPVEYIICGLGNPGKKYDNTHHNAGFMAVDCLAEKCGATVDRLKYRALVGDAVVGGKRVLLMKPQTFMNNSGEAVAEAITFR